jgi:hypothetical protein
MNIRLFFVALILNWTIAIAIPISEDQISDEVVDAIAKDVLKMMHEKSEESTTIASVISEPVLKVAENISKSTSSNSDADKITDEDKDREKKLIAKGIIEFVPKLKDLEALTKMDELKKSEKPMFMTDYINSIFVTKDRKQPSQKWDLEKASQSLNKNKRPAVDLVEHVKQAMLPIRKMVSEWRSPIMSEDSKFLGELKKASAPLIKFLKSVPLSDLLREFKIHNLSDLASSLQGRLGRAAQIIREFLKEVAAVLAPAPIWKS